MIPVHVIGMGMSPEDMPAKTLRIVAGADVLVGGRRHLAFFEAHPAEKIHLADGLSSALSRIREVSEKRRVVVLASGDPNFYGIAQKLIRELGSGNVVIHPNVTAVQVACARLGIPLQSVTAVSLHGVSDWSSLERALAGPASYVAVHTDPSHTPSLIARRLVEKGFDKRICVLEDLGLPSERIRWFDPSSDEIDGYSSLNLVIIEASPLSASPCPGFHPGMPEDAFEHDQGLITKSEVRAVILAKLAIEKGNTVWDVGAGCGSVSIETAFFASPGSVHAVELDADRASLISLNAAAFCVKNVNVVHGRAPEAFTKIPDPDRVFVGGSDGELQRILQGASARLRAGGRIVVSAVLLGTLNESVRIIGDLGLSVDVTGVQIARSQKLGGDLFMKPLNPVWIVCGRRP